MKHIFITGITGLLGTNLTHALLNSGYRVTAIARDISKYYGKKHKNLELIQMGLFDTYDEYLTNIDIVVHIAAATATHWIEYPEFEKINCKASIRLFEKAKSKNVSRFVFISTANTIGYGDLNNPGIETFPIKKPFSDLHYAQSKLQAENYLLSHNNGINTIIINPTFMIGPNDSKPSSGKIILMGLNKSLVFYPPGGKNFVPVSDVVQAIISCFEKGIPNERYIIAGENLSYKQFFTKLKHHTNSSTLLIPIPKYLLLFIGRIGDLLRFFKIRTNLSSTNLKALCIKNFYSNKKSIQELDIKYTSLDNAIVEAIKYFQNK